MLPRESSNIPCTLEETCFWLRLELRRRSFPPANSWKSKTKSWPPVCKWLVRQGPEIIERLVNPASRLQSCRWHRPYTKPLSRFAVAKSMKIFESRSTMSVPRRMLRTSWSAGIDSNRIVLRRKRFHVITKEPGDFTRTYPTIFRQWIVELGHLSAISCRRTECLWPKGILSSLLSLAIKHSFWRARSLTGRQFGLFELEHFGRNMNMHPQLSHLRLPDRHDLYAQPQQ